MLKKELSDRLLAALNGAVRNMVMLHRPGALEQNLTVSVAEISITHQDLAHALKTLPKNLQELVFDAIDRHIHSTSESGLTPNSVQ